MTKAIEARAFAQAHCCPISANQVAAFLKTIRAGCLNENDRLTFAIVL